MYKRMIFAGMLAVLVGIGGVWAADFDKVNKGDYVAALKEWRPLAEQGDAGAQYNLGVMYSKGQGVVQDYASAHIWFNVASANGDSEAQEVRDKLAKEMTAEQIVEVQRRTKRCLETDYKEC